MPNIDFPFLYMFNNAQITYISSIKNLLFLNNIYKLSESKEFKRIINEPSRLKGNRLLIDIIAVLFAVIYPVIATYHFLSFVKQKRKKGPIDKKLIDGHRVFFYFLNKSLYRVATTKELVRDEDVWIVEHNEICKEVSHCISMFGLVSYKDLLLSYIVALLSYYESLKKYGIIVVFLGLNTYKWHVKYRACMNIPTDCEVFFCNHMDQNAAIIDALPHKHKSLIQHGTLILLHNRYSIQWPLMKENKDYHFWTYNVPCKYNTIERVFTFSETEYYALCDSIINNRPEKVIVGYGLKTYDLEGNRKTVLIIGLYRKYADKEREIIRSLQGLNINLVLKNHPTQNVSAYNEMKNMYNFILLNDNRFPKADVVISYDSTLALEYADCGSEVFYYDDYSIESMVSMINNMFTECKD